MENIFINNYWIKTNRLYGTTKSNTFVSSAKGVFRWANNKFIPVTKMAIGRGTSFDTTLVWEAVPTEYVFNVKLEAIAEEGISVSGGAGIKIATITSSRNNEFCEISIDCSGSGFICYSEVDSVDVLKHNLLIDADSNGGNARACTITITQSGSNKKETITIYQAGSSSGGDGGGGGDGEDISSVTANVEQAYWSGNDIHYYVIFNGIENYIDYVTVEVNTSPYGDGTSYGEDRHDTVTSEGSVAGSITVYDQHTELYIVVRNMNGDVIGYKMVD